MFIMVMHTYTSDAYRAGMQVRPMHIPAHIVCIMHLRLHSLHSCVYKRIQIYIGTYI